MSLDNVSPTIRPYILASFNALDEETAGDPGNILNKLSIIVADPLSDGDILPQTGLGEFESSKQTTQSNEQSQYSFAAQIGLSGGYAFFSASVKVAYDTSSYRSGSYFSYSFYEKIDLGSVSFSERNNPKAIREKLKTDLLKQLDSISSLKDAAEFVLQYGTHIVTGVGLGGAVAISIVSSSVSTSESQELSAAFDAKYDGVANFEASAEATQNLSQSYSQFNITASLSSIGPSASRLDLNDPSSFSDFGTSCTTDTVYGVTSTIQFSAIAEDAVQQILDKYTSLVIASRSINYPSIFSESISLSPYVTNTVSAQPPPGYKAIGGGATVTKGSNSFICSCGPEVDSNNGIQGWTASCHDTIEPTLTTDSLTSYCIAVYDEGDVLDVTLSPAAPGSNPGKGVDFATATIGSGSTLAGGGVIVDSSGDINMPTKFLYASRPSQSSAGAYDQWNGYICDYEYAASNIQLYVYSISIGQSLGDELKITNAIVSSSQSGEYPNPSASVSGRIAGGGFVVQLDSGISGSLTQENYPSDNHTWMQSNKDTGGFPDSSNTIVYAMKLSATLNIEDSQGSMMA